MDHLYAPWRDAYVKTPIKGCPFCYISKNPLMDDEHHVLFRSELCFIVMNKYPYTPGHFMIIPHVHTDNIESLPQATWLQMSDLVQQCVGILKTHFGAMGVNIGMNLGKCGGAGIAEHVHYHLVPRWERDTNFITSIADTRVFSTNFDDIFDKLKKLLAENIKI